MSQLLELNMTQKHRLMKTTQLLDPVQNCQNNHSFIYRATSEDVRCSIFNSCWGVDFNSSVVHLQRIRNDPNVFSTRDPQPSGFTFKIHTMYWIALILSSGLNSAKLAVSGQIASIIFHQPVPQQVFPLPPGRNPQLYLWPAAREATEVQDYLGDEYIVYCNILYIAGLGGHIFLCHKCEDAINVHSLPE